MSFSRPRPNRLLIPGAPLAVRIPTAATPPSPPSPGRCHTSGAGYCSSLSASTLNHCPLRVTCLSVRTRADTHASTNTGSPSGWSRRGARRVESWGQRRGHTESQSPEGAGGHCGGRVTRTHAERSQRRDSQRASFPNTPGTSAPCRALSWALGRQREDGILKVSAQAGAASEEEGDRAGLTGEQIMTGASDEGRGSGRTDRNGLPEGQPLTWEAKEAQMQIDSAPRARGDRHQPANSGLLSIYPGGSQRPAVQPSHPHLAWEGGRQGD